MLITNNFKSYQKYVLILFAFWKRQVNEYNLTHYIFCIWQNIYNINDKSSLPAGFS